jgi:hypothetical protein
MHHLQINLSQDIIQLRNDGYEAVIKDNHLLIHNIPYFNKKKEILKGTLVSMLSISQNNIVPSRDHRVFFIGEAPCDSNGIELKSIINNSNEQKLTNNIIANHMFSSKPPNGYKDYYHKMSSYINMLVSHVENFNPDYSAKTFRVIEDEYEESPFNYVDTNSTRAEIKAINDKIAGLKIGIIGLGGTGAFILDSIAKTPVKEIHLFDSDVFSQHNAFRSPGAVSYEELGNNLKKVQYYKNVYSKMHRGICIHDCYINPSNLNLLDHLDFVFISIDRGQIKKVIFEYLEDKGINFIDIGIGVQNVNNALQASVRTSSSFINSRDHLWNERVSFCDDDDENLYSSNIQLSELNSINANFAVLQFKKFYGIYHDLGNELHSVFNTSVNQIINEDVRV